MSSGSRIDIDPKGSSRGRRSESAPSAWSRDAVCPCLKAAVATTGQLQRREKADGEDDER